MRFFVNMVLMQTLEGECMDFNPAYIQERYFRKQALAFEVCNQAQREFLDHRYTPRTEVLPAIIELGEEEFVPCLEHIELPTNREYICILQNVLECFVQIVSHQNNLQFVNRTVADQRR